MATGYFDDALVCENGHIVNDSRQNHPELNAQFCASCGKTIRGAYWIYGPTVAGDRRFPDNRSLALATPPAYCHECGYPYPWTQSALEAAEELIRFNETLDYEEKDELVSAVKDATRDTPRAPLAAEKIKHYGKKLGVGSMNALRDILTDIASEVVKKSMGL